MNVPPSTSALPAGSSRRVEMIGKDAVFDRAEQRGDHAEQKQGEEQQRASNEARSPTTARPRCRSRKASTVAPQWPCRTGRRVRRRTPDRKKNGDDERRGRELDQSRRLGLAEMEQRQEDQRLLEEIVAERRERLAPEQRRKTSRRHQGRGHGSPAVQFPVSRPDFRRPAKNWRCGFGQAREPRGTDGTTDFAFAISEIMALRPEPAAAMAFSACPPTAGRPRRQEPANAVVHQLRLVRLRHRAVLAQIGRGVDRARHGAGQDHIQARPVGARPLGERRNRPSRPASRYR